MELVDICWQEEIVFNVGDDVEESRDYINPCSSLISPLLEYLVQIKCVRLDTETIEMYNQVNNSINQKRGSPGLNGFRLQDPSAHQRYSNLPFNIPKCNTSPLLDWTTSAISPSFFCSWSITNCILWQLSSVQNSTSKCPGCFLFSFLNKELH